MSSQANVCVVLQRLSNLIKSDEKFAELFAQDLEDILNLINAQGAFGKYGEKDPRGDYRNGKWSMDIIEAQ